MTLDLKIKINLFFLKNLENFCLSSKKTLKINNRYVICILANKEDTCSRALCECDKKLAKDLARLEDTSSMKYR